MVLFSFFLSLKDGESCWDKQIENEGTTRHDVLSKLATSNQPFKARTLAALQLQAHADR